MRPGWKLADTPEPVESSAGFYRFRVQARAKATTEFVVREVNQSPTTIEISNIDQNVVAVWVKEKTIDSEMEKSLREVLRLKEQVAELEKKGESLDSEQE